MYSFVTPIDRPTAANTTTSQNTMTPDDNIMYSNVTIHCSMTANNPNNQFTDRKCVLVDTTRRLKIDWEIKLKIT